METTLLLAAIVGSGPWKWICSVLSPPSSYLWPGTGSQRAIFSVSWMTRRGESIGAAVSYRLSLWEADTAGCRPHGGDRTLKSSFSCWSEIMKPLTRLFSTTRGHAYSTSHSVGTQGVFWSFPSEKYYKLQYNKLQHSISHQCVFKLLEDFLERGERLVQEFSNIQPRWRFGLSQLFVALAGFHSGFHTSTVPAS